MSATDDDLITMGETFPRIEAVTALDGLVVLVTWKSGKQVAVDLGPAIHTFKVYAPLRSDRALFETVHVANGSTIAWGADDAIDMHVSEIDRLSNETMDAANFKAWIRELGLTRDSAAAMLGMSRRMIGYYASGHEIPRYVALACAYISARKAGAQVGGQSSSSRPWASPSRSMTPEERLFEVIFDPSTPPTSIPRQG